MSGTNPLTTPTGSLQIAKTGTWAKIIMTIPKPMRLLALLTLAVCPILAAAAYQQRLDKSIMIMLAAVPLLTVVAATALAFKTAKPVEPPEPDKFRKNTGEHKRKPAQDEIFGEKEPPPDLDAWYKKLRPTLHQASFYTVPTYYLDTDLNVLDYNIAFEIVFRDITGRLRGRHVSWFIEKLKNNEAVYEHGIEFTERVRRTGGFPFVDLEPIVYDSPDFGPVEFTKVASQLHDEDGNLQGWAVALMIRSIDWQPFEKRLEKRLYLDKLWSVYSGPYDRVLTQFPPYEKLIQDVIAVVPGESRSVADLGAGTGNVTKALLQKGHRVTAVENNVGMLDHLGTKSRNGSAPTIVKASVENLECLKDEAFDAVVMVNVLYAVDDPLRCLRETYRILKPGGVLGFSTTHRETNLDELLEAIKKHRPLDQRDPDGRSLNDYNVLARVNRSIERTIARKYTREEYRRWVKDAGFEITQYVESTYHNAVLLIHAAKP